MNKKMSLEDILSRTKLFGVIEHDGHNYIWLEDSHIVGGSGEGNEVWCAEAIRAEDRGRKGVIQTYDMIYDPVDDWEEHYENGDEELCCDWFAQSYVEPGRIIEVV
jgi:hypothetical protein